MTKDERAEFRIFRRSVERAEVAMGNLRPELFGLPSIEDLRERLRVCSAAKRAHEAAGEALRAELKKLGIDINRDWTPTIGAEIKRLCRAE